jgi:hypothetical protein
LKFEHKKVLKFSTGEIPKIFFSDGLWSHLSSHIYIVSNFVSRLSGKNWFSTEVRPPLFIRKASNIYKLKVKEQKETTNKSHFLSKKL